MFTRHKKDFADVTTTLAVPGAMVTLCDDTMVETQRGWRAVRDLIAGDQIATLDGGFATVAFLGQTKACPDSITIAAHAFGNCSDVAMPLDTKIGFEAPLGFETATDHVSFSADALSGLPGITRSSAPHQMRVLGFEEEEMIWTQTGLLVHARPMGEAFFETLSFADARALLALQASGHFADAVAA